MVGKPVIQGTRLTVEYILNLLAHGATSAEILAEYDGLTQEDIQACLLFAARALENTSFMPLVAEGRKCAFWSMKAQGQSSQPGYERRDTTSSPCMKKRVG